MQTNKSRLSGKLEVAKITGKLKRPSSSYEYYGRILSNEDIECIIKNIPQEEKEVLVRVQKHTDQNIGGRYQEEGEVFFASFISSSKFNNLKRRDIRYHGIYQDEYLLYGIWEEYMQKKGRVPTHDEVNKYFDPDDMWCYFFIEEASNEENGRTLVTPKKNINLGKSINDIISVDTSKSIWGVGGREENKSKSKRKHKFITPKVIIFEEHEYFTQEDGFRKLSGLIVESAARRRILPVRMEPIRTN